METNKVIVSFFLKDKDKDFVITRSCPNTSEIERIGMGRDIVRIANEIGLFEELTGNTCLWYSPNQIEGARIDSV